MAYEKQTWKTGDIVTSAKLNHMEDGIASGGALIIGGFSLVEGALTGTSDKTWKEIRDAFAAGRNCIAVYIPPNTQDVVHIPFTLAVNSNGTYIIKGTPNLKATTDNENGYPSADQGGGAA